ncbi:hypothetical protein ACIBH1_45890 [Nonomuraea sp. NPDC050663]|uniref:hypothetical protein n=1 Tax=Nonomuraea sp. NPDC050663 TaxID=3364370 RepID=UPI0037AAD62B
MNFMDSYCVWRQLMRPPAGVDEETLDISTDLLVSDEYLLSVANLVEFGIFDPPKVDVISFLDEILVRATVLIAEGDSEVGQAARNLHAYAALSRQLYRQYLEHPASEVRTGL